MRSNFASKKKKIFNKKESPLKLRNSFFGHFLFRDCILKAKVLGILLMQAWIFVFTQAGHGSYKL
jgi:hypothetical protein